MKFKFIIFIFAILITSCSKLEVEDEVLPDISGLTPSSIETQLPVINLNADPFQFNRLMIGYFTKIIIDGEFNATNNTGINELSDIKVQLEVRGRSSVGPSYPLKSLGVTFEEPIDPIVHSGFQPQKLLPGHHLDFVSAIRLRSSGNDFGITMMKDLVYSRFAVQNNLDLELMYGMPVQVFVNDAYYGLMNARSESNIPGISSLLKINPEEMSMVKVKDESENLKFDEGNRSGCETFLRAIKEGDAKAIRDNVDESNFIDYIIYQDYIGNADWANNVKAFNSGNGKFRFIFYDVDLAGNVASFALQPKLEFLSADIAKVYRAFQENKAFNERLERRKKELYERFSVSSFNKIVDDLATKIENDIPYLIAKYDRPKSTLHWRMEVEKLKLDFEGRDRLIRKKYDLD